MTHLIEYSWPGNMRDFEGAVEHYVAFGRLPDFISRAPRHTDWRERLDEVLHRHRGNRTRAAAELGVSRQTVYEELRRREAVG